MYIRRILVGYVNKDVSDLVCTCVTCTCKLLYLSFNSVCSVCGQYVCVHRHTHIFVNTTDTHVWYIVSGGNGTGGERERERERERKRAPYHKRSKECYPLFISHTS